MTFEQARERIQAAGAIAVITGSGISAESGIPTFRGQDGLWKSFRAEELASQSSFDRDPTVVWEWYEFRRKTIARAQPNAAHVALAQFARDHDNLRVVTQNVDGLHQRAGSRRVVEVHGSIWDLRCTRCGNEFEDQRVPLPVLPPRCPAPSPGAQVPKPGGRFDVCGGLMRPGVVWFGEPLPQTVWDNASNAVAAASVVLVVGTSAVVYPVALLAPEAKARGAVVIEVNLEDTPLTSAIDLSLKGPAGEILPKLLA